MWSRQDCYASARKTCKEMERVEVVVGYMEIPPGASSYRRRQREGACAMLGAEGREIQRVWKRRQLGSGFRNDRV